MDYEDFKVQFASMLSDGMTASQIVECLDSVASAFTITRKASAPQLRDAIESFLSAKLVEEKSKKTLKLYRSVLSAFFSTLGKPVAEITTDDIRSYLSSCRSRKKRNRPRKLKKKK